MEKMKPGTPNVESKNGLFTLPAAVVKTGTITSAGVIVTGDGTAFKTLTQVRKGDYVYSEGRKQVRKVMHIHSDTRLDVESAFAGNVASESFKVIRPNQLREVEIQPDGTNNITVNGAAVPATALPLIFSSDDGLGAPIVVEAAVGSVVVKTIK